MKKFLLCMLLILSSICVFGCTKSSISYADSSVEIYINQSWELDDEKVSIVGKNKGYYIISLDENIAKVEGKKVTPVGVGNTMIRLVSNAKKNVYFDITFEVKSGHVALNARAQNPIVNIDLAWNSNTIINPILVNEDCDEIPVVECDKNIATFDYSTGTITAQNEGSTTVSVKFKFVTAEFVVNVTKSIYTALLEAKDTQVYLGENGKLDFTIFPLNASAYRFWCESEDLIVYKDGSYSAKALTTAVVYYQYYMSATVQSEVKSIIVEVIRKITDFDFTISSSTAGVTKNLVAGETYTLKINLKSDITSFIVSDNVTIKKSLYLDENGYPTMEFAIDQTGEQEIIISYSKKLNGAINQVSKSQKVKVEDLNNIELCIKWLANELVPNKDGKYELYLNGTGLRPDRLYFTAKLAGNIVDVELVVYLLNDDGTRSQVSREFVPDSTGKYTFEVEFDGKILEKVFVLVLN